MNNLNNKTPLLPPVAVAINMWIILFGLVAVAKGELHFRLNVATYDSTGVMAQLFAVFLSSPSWFLLIRQYSLLRKTKSMKMINKIAMLSIIAAVVVGRTDLTRDNEMLFILVLSVIFYFIYKKEVCS